MIIRKVKLLLVIAFCGLTLYVNAQIHTSYTVIKVSGKVLSKILNREIRTGDVVKPDDRLTFNTKDAYLHVINAEGMKTIRNVPDNSPREFMQLMQTFLSPEKKSKASRGGSTTSLEIIKRQLAYDTLLILGAGSVSIDTTETTLHDPAGVSVSYMQNGKRVTKITSSKSGFYLGKSYLFSEAMDSYHKVTIMYHEDKNDPYFSPSIQLGSFVPVYVNEETLQKELKAMVNALSASHLSNDKTLDEVIHYLTVEYATPVQENVHEWMVVYKLLSR